LAVKTKINGFGDRKKGQRNNITMLGADRYTGMRETTNLLKGGFQRGKRTAGHTESTKSGTITMAEKTQINHNRIQTVAPVK